LQHLLCRNHAKYKIFYYPKFIIVHFRENYAKNRMESSNFRDVSGIPDHGGFESRSLLAMIRGNRKDQWANISQPLPFADAALLFGLLQPCR